MTGHRKSFSPRQVEVESTGGGCSESGQRARNDSFESLGWYSRGYLPHFDKPGVIQHITFHLADSLPPNAITRMQGKLETLPEDRQLIEKLKRIEALLDRGMGSCILRRNDCARIVENAFLFGDGSRYTLLGWVIMPNHVHVLIEQLPNWTMGRVVQSWKRHTSRQIGKIVTLGSPSCTRQPLWQRDYWDRYIRNIEHFQAVQTYIGNNPVVAGLVAEAKQWPWGSARFGWEPSVKH